MPEIAVAPGVGHRRGIDTKRGGNRGVGNPVVPKVAPPPPWGGGGRTQARAGQRGERRRLNLGNSYLYRIRDRLLGGNVGIATLEQLHPC